jgi:hypothetical protein
MTGTPLTVESPEALPGDGDLPAVPNTNTPAAPEPSGRARRKKSEFTIIGDIQKAFDDLPSNVARQRVWEYVTNWVGETYGNQPLQPISDELANAARDIIARSNDPE